MDIAVVLMGSTTEVRQPDASKSTSTPEVGKIGQGASQILSMIDGMEVAEPEKSIAKMLVLMGANPTNILISGASRLMTAEAERQNPKLELPSDYTETERVLHEMLIENTKFITG